MALSLEKTLYNGTTAEYWKLGNITIESVEDPAQNGMLSGRELSEEEQIRIKDYTTNKLNFNIRCQLNGYVSQELRNTKNITIVSQGFNFKNVNLKSTDIANEDNLYIYLYKKIKLETEFSTAKDC